ncbi:MAG: PAS domain-containing sensor histidine kinase [Alphaproteobacteria bacterium]|nr:PAS domain-containing sensor histidine kinase [Alphaproteobacteria bacterium]
MAVDSSEAGGGIVRQLSRWLARYGVARKLAFAVAAVAFVAGLVTYSVLTRKPPDDPDPDTVIILLNIDLALLLILVGLVCWRIVRSWGERRRGSAGSRLMTRLVVLFSLVAATPAVVVAVFSAMFFNLGIQAWFSERVRTALKESLEVTSAYLTEHQESIRSDVMLVAEDLNTQAALFAANPALLERALIAQSVLRSLPEAIIFEGRTGRVLASTSLSFSLRNDRPPDWAVEKAQGGDVAILTNPENDGVRALVLLDRFYDAYLFVGRYVEGKVLDHVTRTTDAVDEYQRLEGKSSGLQISFFLLFAVVALLLMAAAVWLGLMFAGQLARPISALVAAAEKVRRGDLGVRVAEGPVGDELGTLSRAFNRMTDQLETQRRELIEANRQLDGRRRFTETVLSGVSAGVIGLDADGRIDLPNRSASELLSSDVGKLRGERLADAIPEMADLMEVARAGAGRLVEAQIKIQRSGRLRTLLVRITAEQDQSRTIGYVVTFDDITELQAAQRNAAWSDVARRIAHEMKNPLTPIQLSAERLKRKYADKLDSDREVFETCTDTIIRHVDDIGRMVDEFSAFARMPAPKMAKVNLSTLCREAIFLQSSAHQDISYGCELGDEPIHLRCDSRQIGQCLTNLLQNAADSILDRQAASDDKSFKGRISLSVGQDDDRIVVEVRDNGKGIPLELRDQLTEPYVTTRQGGTGLGLAIVKKIMEDHSGDLLIDNAEDGGAVVSLVFTSGAAGAEAQEESEEEGAQHGRSEGSGIAAQ